MAGVVVYLSVTGNTEYFVQQTNLDLVRLELNEYQVVSEPYVLVVPSYEEHVMPEVIDTFRDFLGNEENLKNCIGIFASGNVNFGERLFCVTGKTIAREFNVPLLHTFELMGSKTDIEKLVGVFNEH